MIQALHSKKLGKRLLFSIAILIGIFVQFKALGQVGTPTYLNVTANTPLNTFPLNSTTSNKIQWIYSPGAFTSLGGGSGTPAPAGNLITKVYIKFGTTINATNQYTNFTISLGQNVGAINNFPETPATTGVAFNTGLTQSFFQASGFAFTGIVANAWYGITLQTPFAYDPSLALVMEVKVSAGTGNSPVNLTTAGISQRLYAAYAATTGTANTGLTPVGFDMIPASVCSAPPTPGTSTATPASGICPGANIALGLTGNSTGSGQTYQWQESTLIGGPYSNIGSSSPTPSLNTPASTTKYYRCEVTCSGNSQYSTPILVTVNSLFPGGTYTINSALPTGGGNYQTFTDAVLAIQCGIAGPVVFDVAPGSGPYTEQVIIPQIFGTSTTNTVTFSGHGATIIASSANTNQREAILLNGADHITIDSVNINVSGGTYGWGIRLTNSADSNVISNCQILALANSNSTNFAGIIMSNSATAATTAGDNGDGNLFQSNTITNGYYGFVLAGNGTAPFGNNNRVIGNTIIDHYLYGIYSVNNENTEFSQNTIYHYTRNTTTSCYGVFLTTNCSNVLISKNRVYNLLIGNPTSTSTTYGLYVSGDGLPGTENKLYNNIIYDFKGNGTQYGIYNTGGDYMRAFHNTVAFDDINATSGASYGIYQTGAVASVNIKNNIIQITRAGTGTRYGFGFVTAGTYISCNNNDIYLNSGGSDSIGIYTTIAYTTLANWQTANLNAYDGASVSLDPMFTDPLLGDFTPTNAGVNSNGANVGVADDFLGNPRTLAAPDPGAYEWTPLGTDAGITWISPMPPVSLGNQTITVEIANAQTATITSLELSYTDGVSTVTETFGPLSLTPGNNQQFSFATPYSIVGNVDLRAYVSLVNGVLDDNQANDTTSNQNICPVMSGNYTINSAVITGGTNFQSFTDAVTQLICSSVNGPVVFDVVPGSGPYNEQVFIPAITGASATNTITFNGNLNTILFASVNTNQRAVITLSGADHIYVDSLVINASTGTYGFGVHLTAQADSNKVTNCIITNPANTTSTNFAGIVMSGSLASATTAGNSGNGNEISGNTIYNGYYGITITGTSAAPFISGNRILNNTIVDHYLYGVYSLGNTGTEFSGNVIRHNSRTTFTTMYGLFLTTNTIGAQVNANRIHNFFSGGTSSSTGYGIYVSGDALFGSENKVTNNLVYNFHGTGIHYGLYNTGGNYMQALHNTVSFDNATAASGTSYGIYQTTAADSIQYYNNNISITRGGTGTRFGIFFNTAGTYIKSNYNNIYVNTPGSDSVGHYAGTSFTTLVNWQTANGGVYDLNSLNVFPLPINPFSGNYQPLNATLNNTAAPLNVADDLNGNPRSLTTPDIGAYEFDIYSEDIGATELIAPIVSGSICYSTTEIVVVRIQNYGLNPIDFAINPALVTCNVTGAITATLTGTPTGILPVGGFMDVPMSTSLDMSVFGSYTFNGEVNMLGDLNSSNDMMTPVIITPVPIVVGTITSSVSDICTSGTPTFTLNGSIGNIQWQTSTVSSSGPWTNVGANLPSYIPTTPFTQTTHYRVIVSCNSSLDSSAVGTINVNSPVVTSTTSGSNCGPGIINLSATTSSPTLNWYDVPTGGVSLSSGPSFSTPFISSTTTYYVAAGDGAGTFDLGLPNRVGATTNSGYSDIGLMFDATQPFTLQSVAVYPVATTPSGNVTITIALKNSAGTTLQSITTNIPTSVSPGIKTLVPLNFVVPAGTQHRLVFTSATGGGITGFIREATTGYTYPYNLSGVASITSAYTSGASSAFYYYFYDWKLIVGCEGVRVPVIATISSPPAMTVSSQYAGVCLGGSTDISVASANDPNYEYTWSSNPAGFTASGNGPHTVSPTVTTTYIVSALDTSSGANSGCINIDSVTVIYTPALTPGIVSASSASYCFSGAPTLSVSGASGFKQWQESTVSGNGPWTNVGTGTNTYVPGTIAQTTYYRLLVSCETNLDSSNVDTVIVFLPQVLSANGDTRCGPGTLNLTATTDPGYNLNWFANSTGGTSLGSGSPFVTPFILQTDTFYVESNSGSGSTDSLQVPLASGATTGVYHHMFTVSAPTGMQINKIGIKCNNTIGTLTAWDIYYRPDDFKLVAGANTSSTGWILVSTVTNVPSQGATAYTTIATGINIDIPAGATYSIYVAPVGAATHQYGTSVAGTVVATNTVGSVIAGYRGGALFNCTTTSGFPVVSLEYSLGCPSARVPVIATVTPSPAIAISGMSTICAGDSSNLTITTGLGDYTNFDWFPTTGLSSATGSNIYAAPTVTTKYYVLASGNVGNCQALDSITITVNDFSLSLGANTQMLCGASDSTQFTTTASGGTFTYLWTPATGLSSDIIANPKARPVGSSETYTVTVTNTLTGCTKTRTLTIYVSAPAILSTVTDTVCGTDQVTLTATATPGTQISWWNALSGGTRLAVGSPFTPTISTTTKYYIEARDTIAQTPVSTGFTGGIIATDPNAAGNMFNVTAINNLRVTGFDVHLDTVSSLQPSNIAVYYKVGSYAGSTLNPSAWTLAGTANGVISSGRGVATPLPLSLDIPINAGQTYGFYLVVTNLGVANSLVYNSSGTSPAEFAVASSDNNLQVRSGTVIFGPFTGQVATPFNRLWNGNVKYDIGCISARDSVEAVSLTAPAITLTTSPNDTICAGSSVTLQATSANDPNYSYQWNPGALPGASVVVTPSAQTKYYVTATDTSSGGTAGCIAVDSVTINLFTLPIVSPTATPSTICAGGTSQLAANALGATPSMDSLTTNLVPNNQSSLVGFDIVNTSGLPVTINNFSFVSNQAAGIVFPVTVMYNPTPMNCVFPGSLNPLPSGWVSLGVTNVTSAGAAPALTFVPLNANITIPPGATYAFAIGSTTGSTIRYTNGVPGCPNVVSDSKITIKGGFGGALIGTTFPDRNFTGRVSYTIPSVGSLSYLWTPSTGLSSATASNPTATLASTTNFTVVVTNNNNGCTSSGNVNVNVNDGPKPVIVENDTTLCNPNQIYIHVVDTGAFSGGYPAGTQFTWSAIGVPIVGLDSISSINGSSYSVIVTLPNGCTAASDTITVLTKSVAVVDAITNATCTNGGKIVATVTSGIANYNYVWSTDLAQSNIVRNVTNSSNMDSLENLAAGTYYLQVYDEAGTPASCNSGILTYVVGATNPIVASINTTNITCNGAGDGVADVLYSGGSAPYSIVWSDGNFTNTTPRGISLGGNYSVIVSDLTGCADTVAFAIVEPLPVTVTFTSTPSSGATGTVTAIPAGGTGPYTVDWADEFLSPAGSGNPLIGIPAGLYYGLVTDANLCTNTLTLFGDTIRVDSILDATLKLKLIIEGLHDGLGGMTAALFVNGISVIPTEADSIVVELRDPLSPSTVVHSATVVVNTNDSAMVTLPGSVIGNSYYIAMFHRNAVQTWSDLPVTFAGVTNYDFTTAASQAYFSNQIQLAPGVFAFYSGDVNQDEVIDIFDQIDLDNDIFNFASGYLVTDLTGEGSVDVFDQIIMDNNIFNFIGSSHP